MNMAELDEMYARLRVKCTQLVHSLQFPTYKTEWGWYSGNYYKNDAGEYQLAEYPIPVIAVKGLCDVEINLDSVSVSTKRGRLDTVNYPFTQFEGAVFEVFSIEQYLDEDYYGPGISMEAFRENMRKSQEKELGFSFSFDFDVGGDQIYQFSQLLDREGFYY